MSVTLFDIAAFWPEKNTHIFDHTDDALLHFTKRSAPAVQVTSYRKDLSALRSATLLDISNLYDAWDGFIQRNDPFHEVFRKCLPPWNNVFVFARAYGEADDLDEIGVHVQLLERVEAVKRMQLSQWPNAKYVCLARCWSKIAGKLTAITDLNATAVMLDAGGGYLASFSLNTRERAQRAVTFALFGFQINHCRNIVSRESTRHAVMPRGLKNRAPKITYHVLEIADIASGTGRSKLSTRENAKHICRGNFAHYTEEKPLFGKYTGMFWRPMHIRGSAKHGIVGKEYAMAPPSGEATA